MVYPINEIFVTLQGEGNYTGTPSIFIRLQGCDVGCPWCDTKHTWALNQENKVRFNIMLKKTEDSPKYAETQLQELSNYLQNNYNHIKHVVITGGEPAMYNLKPLCELLEQLDKSIQIETSGTYQLLIIDSVWVTLSPKINMPNNKEVLKSVIFRANEIKMPIGKMEDINKLKKMILDTNIVNKKIFLQPLSQNQTATKMCIAQALENNWNLSVQLHKYLSIR
jgi:7-carboxy-7-deazaguanine synthase